MTENNQRYSPLNHRLAVILSLSFGLLLAFFMYAGFIFGEHRQKPFDTDEANVFVLAVARFITGVLSFYVLYEFCFWIFRKKWKNSRKYFAAFFGTIALATLISPVVSTAVLYFFQPLPEHLHHFFIRINIAASVIVFFSTLFLSIYFRNHQVLLENQRLVAENIRNRHEALKNQLNPHFLFNSLNTLDGLIGFDDEKAHNYLQNLSSIFRYTIQNKEITTLNDELNFVESYSYLVKIRYGDNLNIQYAVDEKYLQWHIMPVSLQLLLENAIKHNVINDKRPLTIYVATAENAAIKVSNSIQPKLNAETGEGIGLANLVERYRLLFGAEVIITKNGVFEVEIPLIKQL